MTSCTWCRDAPPPHPCPRHRRRAVPRNRILRMTRPLSRRLLTLALATALSLPAWAQTAFAPFVVSDIRVDGLQRIGAGTVFTYLPVERGDTLDSTKSAQAIRALYKTGFFEDVRLGREGNILVVTVVERPAINKLTITGNKDIKTEDLTKGLN